MKKIFKFISFVLLSNASCFSQTINFTDLELKQYLINEVCVDTTDNGISFSHDLNVDLNNDNEIQISEAQSVQILELEDFTNSYSIKSLQDLNSFPNLKYLKILSLDSLVKIENLKLDSLKTLWVSDGASLRIIDISNLPGLTTGLRIEGLTTLDSLNIKNGSIANLFSLFYTLNIKYACGDSIAAEYNAFNLFGAMLPGVLPSINCIALDIENNIDLKNLITIYPNPTSEFIEVKSKKEIKEFRILNMFGQTVFQTENVTNSIDVSFLKPGIYFINIQFEDRYLLKKMIKI